METPPPLFPVTKLPGSAPVKNALLCTECTYIIANAHARLHTTAVRESAALHSGKELYTHSRVFPAGSAPRAFPHMLPSLRRKGPRYLIIYLFSAVLNPLHCILGKSCTHILGSFRQARLLGPFRTCFRVYDGKARGI